MSLLHVFLDIEGRFYCVVLLFIFCQKHKTPLRPMRLYSFIQLNIKCMETELSMKI
jgi:hypothetical protein